MRLARRFRQRIAAAVIVLEPVGDYRLRYRLATVAAHRAVFSTDLDRQFDIIRNRLAAVITGSFRHANEKRRRSAFPVQERSRSIDYLLPMRMAPSRRITSPFR